MNLRSEGLTAVFESIYRDNAWTNKSGPGSLAKVNKPFISFLSTFINKNQIRAVCDFGCGDWQYMRHVKLHGAQYFGFDVAPSVLESNKRLYASETVSFQSTPNDVNALPEVDLFLSKDTFMHLPNRYVQTILREARRKSRFILSVTNDPGTGEINTDILPGEFRNIDLRAEPFNMRVIDILEYSRPCIPDPGYPKLISLALRKYVWPGRKVVQLIVGDRV